VLPDTNSDPLTSATGSIEGRMKIIDPLMSTGPSARVEVVQWSDSEVCVRLPRQVFVGATIHLRTADKIFVGEVRDCHLVQSGHEIHIRVNEILTCAPR
jgi:hypothetical protein